MRWATRSTWFRIAVLFGICLLVPMAWFSLSCVPGSMEIVKSLVFLVLPMILPILAMGFGAWNGIKEGLNLLWLLAPFVCFLAPMRLFLSDSALIYGVGYSLLGFGTHYVDASIYAHSSRRMQVYNRPIRALKATMRIYPRTQTPFHLGVVSLDVAFPILRRLKARATHKHMEELT